jgi:type I restriction enzyme S subunit
MNKWPFVALGEVCDVIAGGTPSRKNPSFFGGDIPWVKISDMLQGSITSTDETITKDGLENSSAKILPSGTVLISIFATIGRTAILGINAATNQAIVGVIPKPEAKLNKNFLRYVLDSSILELTKEARGVAQININGKILKSLKIPLPPLAEQNQIVCLLDEAETLHATRLHANTLMDQFVPALFHEMFGNPLINEKGWPVKKVSDVGEVLLGRQRAPQYQTGLHTHSYVRVANVFEDYLDLSDVLSMDFNERDFKRFKLEDGDILLNEGQSTELVGRPAMWHNEILDCCFQNTLIRFRADRTKTEPEFSLWLFLSYLRTGEFAKISAKTSNVAHLGSGRFANMSYIVPPLHFQKEFAARVGEARAIQSAQGRSAGRVEALYQSMLSRAFAGEL